MKKVKELKSRVAVLLIASLLSANMSPAALGAVFKNSMRAQQPKELKISEENLKMSVGDEKELTVSYVFETENPATDPELPASPDGPPASKSYLLAANQDTPASAPELTGKVTWSSSAEGVVTVSGGKDASCTVTAVGVGPASVTATVTEGSKTYTATCKVVVVKEQLNAKLSKSSISYSESAVISAEVSKLTKAEDSENVTFTLDFDEYAFEVESEEDGRTASYTFTPANGRSGDFTVTVSAKVDGKLVGEKELSLTVKPPKFALSAEKNELDVKGEETTTIFVDPDKSEFTDYTIYEWSVEGDSIELSQGSSYDDYVKVLAVKEGKAIITVEAIAIGKEGPSRSKAVETKATAQYTITVKDSRVFAAEPEYVVLDINPKNEIRSVEFEIINDYTDGDPLQFEVVDEAQLIEVAFKPNHEDEDNHTVIVTTEADKTGSASIIVKRMDDDEVLDEISVPVIIMTSGELPVIKGGVEVVVKPDAVKPPTVNMDGLNNAQKLEAQAKADAQKNNIEAKIIAALNVTDSKLQELLASKVSISSELAKLFGGAKDGEIVKVYPKQELSDVEMDSVVTVKEDGTVEVKTIITKMVFDISLFMDRLTDAGDVYGSTEDMGANMAGNTKPVSFPVPLPMEGIKESARYAKVTHAGDVAYYRIREEGGSRFVVISTTHFSPFEFEFVDSMPSTGKPSGGSNRGGSTSNVSNWSQDALGWRYKGSDGIYASNTWKTLLWNGTMQWFHFGPEGYMTAGWFTELDGNKYFLHNISDGSQGRMYTGWNQIEGKWYYFKEYSGGPLGSLLTNAVTPDGYTVGADGSCPEYKKN